MSSTPQTDGLKLAHIICDSMLESQETSSSSIIDWDMVASSVSSRYGISTTPAGLRQLWRAIAYDQDSTLQSDEEDIMKHSIPHISRELVGSTSVEWQHRPSTIADLIPDPTVLNPRDVKMLVPQDVNRHDLILPLNVLMFSCESNSAHDGQDRPPGLIALTQPLLSHIQLTKSASKTESQESKPPKQKKAKFVVANGVAEGRLPTEVPGEAGAVIMVKPEKVKGKRGRKPKGDNGDSKKVKKEGKDTEVAFLPTVEKERTSGASESLKEGVDVMKKSVEGAVLDSASSDSKDNDKGSAERPLLPPAQTPLLLSAPVVTFLPIPMKTTANLNTQQVNLN